jgi:hypothetical protein
MTRYGARFGPDITFPGVDRVDLAVRRVDLGHDPAGPLPEGR